MLCVSPLRIASPGNLLENVKAKGGLSKQDYERHSQKVQEGERKHDSGGTRGKQMAEASFYRQARLVTQAISPLGF
jgi:hypothetical protein